MTRAPFAAADMTATVGGAFKRRVKFHDGGAKFAAIEANITPGKIQNSTAASGRSNAKMKNQGGDQK
jgi:hypothetical protein